MKPLRTLALLAFCGAAASGCGGKKGTITLSIVVSPVVDPFEGVTTARFTIGDKVSTSTVTNGHFSFSLDEQPPGTATPIILDGLDTTGNVRAHGETPPITLSAVDQQLSMWVGRPGTIAGAVAVLPSPRTEMATCGSTGLGAVFAGGRDATGAALKSTAVYDVFTQQMLPVSDLSTPRAAAVAVSSSPRGIVLGGAQSPGFGSPTSALSTSELFDPSTGTGIWTAVPASPTPVAFSQANLTVLGSGVGLVTGGRGETGAALNSAAEISTGGTVLVTPFTTGMNGRRVRHAVAAALFPDGDGALVIGGLADDDPAPVVERLIAGRFTAYPASGLENRWDATASSTVSPAPSGVVLAGGTILANGVRTATTSVVLISTQVAATPTVTRFDSLVLPTPRAGHTATAVGTQLLLCGGYDDKNQLLGSCELLETSPTLSHLRTIAMSTPRKGHSAVQLETGIVLVAGGLGQDGQPLASIEIFTPLTK